MASRFRIQQVSTDSKGKKTDVPVAVCAGIALRSWGEGKGASEASQRCDGLVDCRGLAASIRSNWRFQAWPRRFTWLAWVVACFSTEQ